MYQKDIITWCGEMLLSRLQSVKQLIIQNDDYNNINNTSSNNFVKELSVSSPSIQVDSPVVQVQVCFITLFLFIYLFNIKFLY